MSKRRYTNMVALLPVIEGMLATGIIHREIEDELGLEGDRPVHNLLKQQQRKAAKGMPKFRGRKPAKTLQEYKYENKRLKLHSANGKYFQPRKPSAGLQQRRRYRVRWCHRTRRHRRDYRPLTPPWTELRR